MEKGFKDGVKDVLFIVLGYILIGLVFGIVVLVLDLFVIEVGFMSVLVYGGFVQFVMCVLLLVKVDLMIIMIIVFLVNLRNMLMSLYVIIIFKFVYLMN